MAGPYGRLRERGALMVAISPQTERQNDFMAGRHGLPFSVLSDPGCVVAEQFGLVYTVPQYHRDYYLSILVNIPFVNGDTSWRLPLPATYVIRPDGRVVFAEAHADSTLARARKKRLQPPSLRTAAKVPYCQLSASAVTQSPHRSLPPLCTISSRS